MDILTHALVPLSIALIVVGAHRRATTEDRAPLGIAVAAGLGGAAPDFDGLFSWAAKTWDAAYFFQHRGVSHTLIGAPLFALGAVAALSLLWRWKPDRFPLLRPRPAVLLAAMLGGWSHLALDSVTLSGVPWAWPFGWTRFSFQLFPWLVAWLFPVSGLILLGFGLRRLSPRRVAQGGVAVLGVLVALGGIRVATSPTLAEDEVAFPRSSVFEWVVVKRLGDASYEASLLRDGDRREPVRFEGRAPPGSEEAVARARAHDSYLGWRMETYGPLVVIAEPASDNAWNVSFIDVAARYEATHGARWTPAEPKEDWGIVSFRVTPDAIEVTKRGW